MLKRSDSYGNYFQNILSSNAMGILDFYHAAQNLWKGIAACLDGRTKKALAWFVTLRHSLRHDDPDKVFECIVKCTLNQR